MKKIIILAIAAALCLSFTACENNYQQNNSNTTEAILTEQKQTPEPPEEKELPSAEAVLQNIREAYGEDIPHGMPIPDDMLEGIYGITPDLYDECAAEMAAISIHAHMIIVIKAKADKIEEAKTALENLRETLISDTLQYPMNIEKVQATSVTKKDDYFALILAGAPNLNEELTESERKEFAVEQNNIGITAFLAMF